MAVPGHNIRLTIDRDLQASAYRALTGRVGSAVAIDVNTGEVLAMVSRPSFNPSLFSRGISRDYWKSIVENDKNPLRDRHHPRTLFSRLDIQIDFRHRRYGRGDCR